MSDMALEIPIRPITAVEYHRMVRDGIIRDDERIELLGGMLVEMPPLGQSHITAHTRIVKYLIERLGDRLAVAGQASIALTLTDEPEPDISLFLPGTFEKPKSQWTGSDTVVLIEISDSSLRRDLGPKLRAYARGDIAEYIVVDLLGCTSQHLVEPATQRVERWLLRPLTMDRCKMKKSIEADHPIAIFG